MKIFISTSAIRPKGEPYEELTPLQEYKQLANRIEGKLIRQTRYEYLQNNLKLADLAKKVPKSQRTARMNDLISRIPEMKKSLTGVKNPNLKDGYAGYKPTKPLSDSPAHRAIADLAELSEKDLLKLGQSEIGEIIETLKSETPKPKNAAKNIKMLQALLDQLNANKKKVVFNFKKPISYKRENLDDFLLALLSDAERKDIQKFELDGTFQKFGAHPPLIKQMLASRELKRFGYKATLHNNSEGTLTISKR